MTPRKIVVLQGIDPENKNSNSSLSPFYKTQNKKKIKNCPVSILGGPPPLLSSKIFEMPKQTQRF